MDTRGDNFIDYYVASIATINGVKYTVGSPCDHPVALCMYDEQDELVTIELDMNIWMKSCLWRKMY